MSGGGSGAAASLEFPSAEWRRAYDRLQGLLPRVEALAADRARLEEIYKLSETREKSFHARLLQAEASRDRWKTAYTELPPGATPKFAELEDSDSVDFQTLKALTNVDDSQLKQVTIDDTDEMHLEQCTMKIFVKIDCSSFRKKKKDPLFKDYITLEVMGSDAIYDVKDKIQDKEGISAGKQRLWFDSELLVGSCTLKGYNIEEESTLTLDLVPQGMHIFVRTLNDKIMTIEVEREDSIYSVKTKVFDESGILPGRECLVFAGKKLEDGRTLADYGVRNGSTLYFVFRCLTHQRGGMHITVRTLTDKIVTTVVEGEDSVYSVKVNVFNETGVPPGRQRLIFNTNVLEDGRTLADCDVQHESTLYLVLRRMHIILKTVAGKKIIEHAYMHPQTIDDIKSWIYSELGILPEQQQLSDQGGAPLAEEIFYSCTLVLQICPPGGQ